jgi:predicted transcriptional regulator
MLDHRLQILLDEEQYQKVARLARSRGTSVAAVIRDAIDTFPVSMQRRDAAIAAILAADPVPLPEDPRELRAELDEAHPFS